MPRKPRERTDAQREADKRYGQNFAQFNVRVSKSLAASAKRLAKEKGTTLTEMVRALIEDEVFRSTSKNKEIQ